MQEFYEPLEMKSPGSEFHEPMQEMYNGQDEFSCGIGIKKKSKKRSLANARKLFYLLAGSATIASIGFLAK